MARWQCWPRSWRHGSKGSSSRLAGLRLPQVGAGSLRRRLHSGARRRAPPAGILLILRVSQGRIGDVRRLAVALRPGPRSLARLSCAEDLGHAQGLRQPNAIGAVISRTCELARYLESRILASPELELMASVELNIVCFRYRFATAAGSASDELSDQLNREIVISCKNRARSRPRQLSFDGRLGDPRGHREPSDQPRRNGHPGREDAGRRPGTAAALRALGRPGPRQWQPWLERDARRRSAYSTAMRKLRTRPSESSRSPALTPAEPQPGRGRPYSESGRYAEGC
jgi:hypothetical protein